MSPPPEPAKPATDPGEFRVGQWTVHQAEGTLTSQGRSLRLEPRVMDVLVHLASAPGRVISKEELLEAVWGGSFVEEGALAHVIHSLRKALGDDAHQPQYIQTIPKRGYRLVAPVVRGETRPETKSHAPGSSTGPRSERRQVTVVCCELVGLDGGSGLPRTFDPETLHELMLQLRALADGVTKHYDGQRGSLLGGQRILICFGYPQAHEDNARRAVRAALELADQVARWTAGSGQGRAVLPALRVGVHTGLAVVSVPPQDQEPMTLGATLDLAVALQSLAEPGRVVASPATCSLIAKSFVLEALAPAQLPESDTPLIPCRVLEPLEAPGDGPGDRPPLVGREREMELMLSRWALAQEGNGQVVLISGEPGIGKSRLVLGLQERLDQNAVHWRSCFGSPYAQSTPLQPVVGLLREVLPREEGASPLDRLAGALGDLGLADAVPLFAPLLDVPLDDRHPAPPLTLELRREKTLDALTCLVVKMAERQPLVLLIEDLHWLDPTTLAWLDRLIHQVASTPLLLLMTLRLQTLESLWGPRAHLTQIALNSLSDAEAEQVVEQVVGERSLPVAVRRQIVMRTDGVPLFLEELTKAVLETYASGVRQELPATLRDSLAARLDRLGRAKEISQVAAVIGRVFSFDLLAAVCPCEVAELQQELRRLMQAELIYRKGFGDEARYLFKHALVQDAAYESLLKRERQQIHRQIAETLATRFSETADTAPEILAHHYTEAGLTGPAVDFWVRAGELASRRSASLEAVSHLDRALRLLQDLPDGPERDQRELRIQTFRAPAIVTARGYADPEIEQAYCRAEILAERLAEAEERFWAVLGLHIYYVSSGKLTQGLDLAERLVRIAESEQRPGFLSIALFSLGVYHFWQSDYPRAISELERAYEIAPPDDDSYRIRKGADMRVLALSYASISLWHLGQFNRARQRREEAITLARQLGFPFTMAFASIFGAGLAFYLRDAETVRRIAREVYDLAVKLGFSYWSWQAPLLLTWSELVAPLCGSPAVELGDFETVQRIIADNAGTSMAYYFCLHAEILLLRERLWDAWRALDEALRLSRARGVSFWVEEIYRLQGEVLLHATVPEELREAGGPAEAERRFQTSLELAGSHGSRSLALRAAMCLGRLWKGQGRELDARDLVARTCQGFTGTSRDLREARLFLDSCAV